MGFETVVGFVVALSVPIWLVAEQVVSWLTTEQSAPALTGGPRVAAPGSASPARSGGRPGGLSEKAA